MERQSRLLRQLSPRRSLTRAPRALLSTCATNVKQKSGPPANGSTKSLSDPRDNEDNDEGDEDEGDPLGKKDDRGLAPLAERLLLLLLRVERRQPAARTSPLTRVLWRDSVEEEEEED